MLAYHLSAVTEAAALACYDWIGRGEKNLADKAAVDAMRNAFRKFPATGTVVIGEGEKDKAPQLYKNETLGEGSIAGEYDIAVDPLEGTTNLAHGLPNAFSVIAMSSKQAMFDPSPAFYMDKLVVPAPARGKVTPDMPIADRLDALAKALSKKMKDLTVYVLARDRHNDLVAQIRKAGAAVALYPAGDVVGSLLAASDDERIDALMGIGGSPEGVISACAVKCLGGDLFAKVCPNSTQEQRKVDESNLRQDWLSLQEMVRGDSAFFCATAITRDGLWLDGIRIDSDHYIVHSCVMSTDMESPRFIQHRKRV